MLREREKKTTFLEENSIQWYLSLQLTCCVIAHKTVDLSELQVPNNQLLRFSLIKCQHMNLIGQGADARSNES